MLANRAFPILQMRFVIARGLISREYTKDYASSSDDEQDKKSNKAKTTENNQISSNETNEEESAVNRLNRLLASMNTEEKFSLSTKINMAKPGQSHKKLKEEAKEAANKKDVFEAAKRVASFLGHHNKQQTESELLNKLLQHKQGLSGSRTAEDTLEIEQSKASGQKDSELSLSELIVKMKVDRNPQPPEESRADFVRRTLANQRTQYKKPEYRRRPSDREFPRSAETYTGSVNLFGGEPLGIFKNVTQFKEYNDLLPTWSHLQQRELQLQVARPPSNYFEKLIQWTEQGKIWRFPINNEQDISEDQAKEDFSDHIFLEQHLEGWCPAKGPIRHFMELVCVGLSKNPYITAKDKKEHILWFRDYFESKKQMLKDLMSQDKLDQISTVKPEVLPN